jgi:ElaA protein
MTENDYKWVYKPFHELNPAELYQILQLRQEVFVIEQACIFQDLDNRDQQCHHLMVWDGDLLVAGTRILPVGLGYPDYPSIGRVLNKSTHRGTGLGKELMERSIEICIQLYGDIGIKIGAQYYLKKFYASLGFVAVGEIYDEDGIDHIKMIRAPFKKLS